MNNNLQQEWLSIVEKLKKDKSLLYEFLKDSSIKLNGDSLELYISNEEDKNKAQKSIPKICAKLPAHLKQKRLVIVADNLVQPQKSTNPSSDRVIAYPSRKLTLPPVLNQMEKSENPLQKLNNKLVKLGNERNAEQIQILNTLKNAVDADKTCSELYEKLTAKTVKLAEETLCVTFPWLLRVGGMRGFRELLLPVFHPVYGIPYIPSSSLKGAIRAIASQNNESELDRLLGNLKDGIGCIQILDAFPTAPCLSLDIVNPQWHWKQNQKPEYQSIPHSLLSLEKPNFVIGFSRTSRGKNIGTLEDLQIIKGWLEKALTKGIGSRVSAGYGKTTLKASLDFSSIHEFKMWTQGIYGANTKNSDFRPVALRGMLRYWFRAIALGIYSPDIVKEFESSLFGTIDPESKVGTIWISAESKEEKKGETQYPYAYTGKILLESSHERHLILVENLLYFSAHLAGIGRGSRRPLHLNNGRMRGCYWEITNHQLPYDQQIWQQFIQQVKIDFQEVGRSLGFSRINHLSNPTITQPIIQSPNMPIKKNTSKSSNRYQDILDNNAAIFLVSCPEMKYPNTINNWSKDGSKRFVLGEGLNLLYSSNKYKGFNDITGEGNSEVGGKLGIPSYVIIQSNFPVSHQPYQAITVFGKDNSSRDEFIKNLPNNPIQVW